MKCELCKKNIETTFLEKVQGTYVKGTNGKKHLVCAECQKKFPEKGDVLKKL